MNKARYIKKRTPYSIPQGMATKKMYNTERKLLEKIWNMNRPRSIENLRGVFSILWDHYSDSYNITRQMPEIRFGKGTKYHGRYLSYTIAREKNEPWLIELAPNERNYYVLVHELVHALGPAQHGIRFAMIYHDLLKHDMFKHYMDNKLGEKFMYFLEHEHPRYVRRAYRNR